MAGNTLKQIIRFLLRLLLITLIILACDRGIGTLLKVFYFRQESGVNYRTTYSIDSTVADILIFGSSRAAHHYVPEIFEDKLHSTCYNAGRDGTSILYDYAVFKAITARYKPQQIIIDIIPHSLEYGQADYERLSILFPYCQKHPEIKRIVNLRGSLEELKHISAIYPYNSLIIQIVMGNLELNKKRDQNLKGYIPIYNVKKSGVIDTLQIGTNSIDANKVQALKDIISISKQKNIKLTFVNSPRWHIINDMYYNPMVYKLCSENDISYLDMSNHSTFINNPGYFADGSHLNDEGARVFTTMLINKIRQTY